jgi:hypothetical protein
MISLFPIWISGVWDDSEMTPAEERLDYTYNSVAGEVAAWERREPARLMVHEKPKELSVLCVDTRMSLKMNNLTVVIF